jgi:bifunctional non-homologous end joining protein LigD
MRPAGLQLCEHMEGYGATIFAHAVALGCEGIVSKRPGSPYRSGRSRDWVKVEGPDCPAVRRESKKEWD